MWIERLEIGGFRRLAGSFAFSPGLNLVAGDNEAGKSSLHDALIRALFGFSRSEQWGGSGSVWQRSRPWDSGRRYGLRAVVREVRGRTYEIDWDFDRHAVRLLDRDTGADESAAVAAKGKLVRLGEHLLGIDLDNFRGICCLDQLAIAPVKRSDWLTNALQQAVASVTSDAGAAGADERLKELVSALGFRTDTYRPTSSGRARQLADEVARLEAELEETLARRGRIEELAAERADQVRRRGELEADAAGLRGRLLRAELQAIEERLAEARRLESAAQDRPERVPDFPRSQAGEIADLRAQIRQVESQISDLERQVEGTRGAAQELEARRADLLPRYDALAAYEQLDASGEAAVREAWAALQALSGRLPTATNALPPASTPRRLAWIALVVLTVGLAWLVRRAARAIGAWLSRRAGEAAALAQRRSLEHRLVSELDRVGADRALDLAERVEGYLRACERRRERAELGHELAELEGSLAGLAAPLTALDRTRGDLRDLESQLRGRFAEIGIAAADLDAAAGALERLRSEHEEAVGRAARADAAAEQLQALLGGTTIQALDRRRGELEERLRAHRERHGEDHGHPIQIEEGERRLEELERTLGTAGQELARVETEIETLERDLPQPAELEELLGRSQAKLDALELRRDAVKLARETLRVAAEETHRTFAPHLNRALARSLPRVTNGRYTEAVVADDLSVRVRAPETGALLDPSQLSRATQDQIFLVQRLEIARLLDPTLGAAPLLLDDPFAHFDPTRLRLGLELLDEIAHDRQVILFSEDPAVRELGESVCSHVHVIELPAPAAARAA